MKHDYKKIIQALSYIARQASGGSVSKLHALKLVYLADRYHLRKYGRTITGDTYYAMHYGPVPSVTKNIIDQTDSIPSEVDRYAKKELVLTKKESKVLIQSNGFNDTSELSETDMLALDKSCAQFWQVDDIVKFTHQFPEWTKHEHDLKNRACTRIKMDVSDFFLQAPAAVEYCDADPDLVAINREHFEDMHCKV